MEKVEDLCRTYIFWKENQDKIRVCKTVFLDTYGVGEKAIKNWKNSTMTTQNNEETNLMKIKNFKMRLITIKSEQKVLA